LLRVRTQTRWAEGAVKKKIEKKLKLSGETVRVLSNQELGAVAGGVLTTAINCTSRCPANYTKNAKHCL
jgi:hypothetical protein